MSVCAIVLVKDEVDLIGYTLDHLHTQVDEVAIYDNGSTDGTRELLEARGELVFDDKQVAYYQSRKTTRAAREAMNRGHAWVLPNDADEVWYVTDGRTISDYLNGITPDVRVVTGELFNHIPTALDDPREPNPIKRIGWRQKSRGALPKVCVRMDDEVVIAMGNHAASFGPYGMIVPGLVLRHFTWRTPDQYLKKITNGRTAYAASNLDEAFGVHWRMFDGASDDVIMEHFKKWFYIDDPATDPSLIFDPAPSGSRLTLEEV